MNKTPKISVIIPVYNGANYIEQAINSVLNQTYPNYEIIVVNDGSTDDGKTKAVAMSFGDKIRYFEKENGGVSSALNFGIDCMEGDYFAWLSHDDLFCETKLEDQVKAIIASGDENTISLGNYLLCDKEIKNCVPTQFEKYFPLEQICNSVFLLFWGEFHFSGLLFHKNHFARIGKFDEILYTAQDNDFIFRLLRRQKLIFVNSPVSKVRLHGESGTSCFHDKVDAENRKLYLQMLKEMSTEEIESLVEENYMLYAKIGGIIQSMGGRDELKELEKSMIPVVNQPLKNSQVIIFGAGQYGRRLKYELEQRGIYAECFIDNSDEKDGQMIDGTVCHKVKVLENYPEATVIVAQKFYKSAVEQLEGYKVKTIMLKMEVDANLLQKGNIW